MVLHYSRYSHVDCTRVSSSLRSPDAREYELAVDITSSGASVHNDGGVGIRDECVVNVVEPDHL